MWCGGPGGRLEGLAPDMIDTAGCYQGGEQHDAAAHTSHHVELQLDELLPEVVVHHHHGPRVGRLPALVDGPALVEPPLGGREVGDLEDRGPGEVSVLQHSVLAGVGQHSPSVAPLHQTGRVGGETAGQTDVVSARIISQSQSHGVCLQLSVYLCDSIVLAKLPPSSIWGPQANSWITRELQAFFLKRGGSGILE